MAAQPIRRAAVSLNGITIAYVMGLVNACMAAAVSFGVHLTDTQESALAAVVNVSLVLAVHVSHRVGETVAVGASSEASRAQTARAVAAADIDPAPAQTPAQ